MIFAQPNLLDDTDTLPRTPSWVTGKRAETLEDVAFLSGAALATLHVVIGRADVPHALLRQRLALRAAEACVGFAGRSERAGELRDEVHLLRPGDQPGPAGAIYQRWLRAAARPISVRALEKALPEVNAEQIAVWLDAGQGHPVARAAGVLEAVLADVPREEATALILADAALARSMGWGHLVPVLAAGLKQQALRVLGDELRLACHKAVVATADEALRIASDLARGADRLRAVASKLRAKRATEAVEMFLSRDALSPSVTLADPTIGVGMSDRAARRLCDRLVELGVVRELTGRATFRLYGL
jgi:Protein of unknown function (DUF1403)